MGEIAEMMLEGTMCEGCGEFFFDEAPGYPRRCTACGGDSIWQGKPDCVPHSRRKRDTPCQKCGKKCRGELGLRQHMRDRHPA